jgi:hypothetical protein
MNQRNKADFFAIPFKKPIGVIMTNNPDTRPGEVAVIIPIDDVPHAPFIFYDGAPVSGFVNGIISLTLAANRTYIGPDGIAKTDHVVVAYLRGNVEAAVTLRQALDAALLMAKPTTQSVN